MKNGLLLQLLADAVAATPERVYATFGSRTVTMADLDAGSSAFSAHLRRLGLKPGDRAAVMMRNCVESLMVVFGLARAGVVWAPINVLQRGGNLEYLMSALQPALVIHDEDLGETVHAALNAEGLTPHVLPHGPAGKALEGALDGPADPAEFEAKPSDAFAIMFTSGTTGRSKSIAVTHRMMEFAGRGVFHLTQPLPGDVFLLWEPLYHIGGAQMLGLPLACDIHLAMVERFSASRFWDQVRQTGATHIHYLGGILQILLKQPVLPSDREHRVRIAWGGGCPATIWRAFEERFGVQIRECYGMTEGSSITTVNDNGTVGSIGRALPWFEVELRDVESGALVRRPDQWGQIVVRGLEDGGIFGGYLGHPTATASALRDGLLHTGDLGSFDADGNLFFHGRMNDSVRVRGENVSAMEVEHVVNGHPAVEDCAIIGVAAEIGEQEIKLFVIPKKGEEIDLAGLSGWLAGRLPPFQQPRYIAIVHEFPRTASERIMKHMLARDVGDCWDRERSANPVRG